MESLFHDLSAWLHGQFSDPWFILGFAGQALFTSRFVVQWIYSERAGKSVMPDMFWYFSLVGSALVLAYAIHLGNLVFILGQFGIIVYIRNIQLIWRHKKRQHAAAPQ